LNRSSFFYGWVIVIASLAIQTVVFGAMYSFGVFFKPLSAELGLSRTATSLVAAIGAVVVGLLGIAAGALSDRYGPRIVVFTSGFLLGLGHLLTSWINAAWQLYLTYGLVRGLGTSGAYSPILSTVARWFEKKRGLALGMVVAGIGLGTMLLLPFSAYLITTYQWRQSIRIIGVLIWVIVLPAALFLRRNPEEMKLLPYGRLATAEAESPSAGDAAAGRSSTLWEALSTRNLWTLLFIFALYAFALGMVMVHLVPYATDIGISPTMAATFMSAIGGASITGRIGMGAIADRIGIKAAMAISLAFMAVPLSLLSGVHIPLFFYLLTIIFGFGYGGMVPQLPAATGYIFGMKSLGSIFGVVTLGATMGQATGPLLAGYIYDVTQSYQSAFLLGVLSLFLGITLALTLKFRPAAS
jgi:MFS family permease